MYIQTSTWVVRVGTSVTGQDKTISRTLFVGRFTWVNSARQCAIALPCLFVYDAPCHDWWEPLDRPHTANVLSRKSSECLPGYPEGCHCLESAAACLFVAPHAKQELAACVVYKTSWSGPTGVAANALTRLARIGAGTITRRRDTDHL